MPTLAEQLTQMAAALNIAGVPATAQPGQSISASLVPALLPLHFTDVVQQPISFDFIAKNVVFANKNIASPTFVEDPAIVKIAQLINFLVVPPALDASGVEGLIGKIKGNLPVAVPVEAIPKLSVTWKVQDDAGNDLVDGSDYLAPAGLQNATLDVVFLPAFARFDGSVPAPTKRKIFAVATLSAANTTGTPAPIGPATVIIPTIPFPKVLALSVDTNFQGPALVMVPGVSAINNIDHIRTLLEPVRNVISTLTTIARFAEMLVGIDTLSSVLNATNIVFSKANPVNNLNDITLVARPWYENDTEAEDELSSFVYISPPPPNAEASDNKVEMCNRPNLGTSEGKFTVSTGTSFVALCSSLHSAAPAISPSSATLTVDNAPAGSRFFFHNITTFGDELSSINFF